MEEREGNGHNASILKHDQLEESEMNIADLVLAWRGGRNLIKHITDVLKVQNILGWKECNTCRFFIIFYWVRQCMRHILGALIHLFFSIVPTCIRFYPFCKMRKLNDLNLMSWGSRFLM